MGVPGERKVDGQRGHGEGGKEGRKEGEGKEGRKEGEGKKVEGKEGRNSSGRRQWKDGRRGKKRNIGQSRWRSTTLGSYWRQHRFSVHARSTHHMYILVLVVERMRWAGERVGLSAHSTGASDAMPSPSGTLTHHTSLKHLQ